MFMEASAKTRENVNDVFYELAEKIIENPALFESSQPKETVNLNAQNNSWMGWLRTVFETFFNPKARVRSSTTPWNHKMFFKTEKVAKFQVGVAVISYDFNLSIAFSRSTWFYANIKHTCSYFNLALFNKEVPENERSKFLSFN